MPAAGARTSPLAMIRPRPRPRPRPDDPDLPIARLRDLVAPGPLLLAGFAFWTAFALIFSIEYWLLAVPELRPCTPATVTFSLVDCVANEVFLNVLLDLNGDGDWNDAFTCETAGGACAHEWAIKNWKVPFDPQHCRTITSPEFLVGPRPGEAWMRITVSTDPARDGFPWQGQTFYGGETEDYPVHIGGPTATRAMRWGVLKSIYR